MVYSSHLIISKIVSHSYTLLSLFFHFLTFLVLMHLSFISLFSTSCFIVVFGGFSGGFLLLGGGLFFGRLFRGFRFGIILGNGIVGRKMGSFGLSLIHLLYTFTHTKAIPHLFQHLPSSIFSPIWDHQPTYQHIS